MSKEKKKSDETPVATVVQSSCMFEVCDLVYAILTKDVAEGDTSGRLREEARVALIEGTMVVDKESKEMTRYPEHIIKASILLGEIKYGIRHKTDLTQEDMNGICAELSELVPNDYKILIEYVEIKVE